MRRMAQVALSIVAVPLPRCFGAGDLVGLRLGGDLGDGIAEVSEPTLFGEVHLMLPFGGGLVLGSVIGAMGAGDALVKILMRAVGFGQRMTAGAAEGGRAQFEPMAHRDALVEDETFARKAAVLLGRHF